VVVRGASVATCMLLAVGIRNGGVERSEINRSLMRRAWFIHCIKSETLSSDVVRRAVCIYKIQNCEL